MTQVLIVEDHEENRNLLKMLLEANGYRVTAAGNGAEALDAARRDPPDAVVSDVLMPKMDGFALCRAWMQDAALRAIPFIFYSATYVRPDDEHFALALGAVRYLIKPLEGEVFLKELRAVLQQWAGHAAPAPASPLDESSAHALHESALARKVEDKMAQLEAANRKLQESEEKYRRIYDNVQDIYVEATLDGTILEMSPQVATLSKGQYKREDLIGTSVNALYADSQYIGAILEAIKEHGRAVDVESVFRNRDGSLVPCSVSATIVRGADGELRTVATLRDITGRKQAEKALERESHRNRVFLRNASDGVHILDADGNVLEFSDSFCQMLGYSREELIGANVSLWDARWSAQELKQILATQIAKQGRSVFETRHRRRDGSLLDVEVTGRGLELDGKPVIFNSARDITERKLAEGALRENQARLDLALQSAGMGVWHLDIVEDRRHFDAQVCRLLGIDPAKFTGTAEEFFAVVHPDDRGTLGAALAGTVGQDVPYEPEYRAIWPDASVHYVTARGRLVRDDQGRPMRINGILWDISETKEAEEQIQRYVAQISNAFMSTVQVVTTLGEMRDPYTAGHQRKVAEIAVAIGAELGFDARRQEGLRVAGYLHDIGKIRIPSEILSKPGKLSPTERQLVQGHAQASYEVLKDVEFPWPVAGVALQHHERMDGSGYPQGLKGEAILLEARIMGVADVIEAMSSHRPYRAGLGIDAALSEIERGRGSAYDAEVADACLKLFRERHYRLPA